MLAVRLLVALALLVSGAAAGLAATLVHQRWWGLLLGLAVAALATCALPVGGRRCAFVVGWFAAITYAVLPRAEGDYLISDSLAGYGFLGGSFVILLTALATSAGPVSRRGSRAVDPQVLEG